MDYNTTRSSLVIPEYGRNIHKMIEHTLLDNYDLFFPKVYHENCVTSDINRKQHIVNYIPELEEFVYGK